MGEINSASMSSVYDALREGGRVQRAKFSENVKQHESGIKYKNFSEISEDGRLPLYMSFRKDFINNEYQVKANETLEQKMDVTSAILARVYDLATEARQTLAQANSSSKDQMNLKQIVTSQLEDLQRLLNTEYGGEYIFAGMDVNNQPVEDIVSKSYFVNGEPTANYIKCDQSVLYNKVDSTRYSRYNILASDEGFVNIIGGLHRILEDRLSEGGELLEKGQLQINELRTEHSNRIKEVDGVTTKLETAILTGKERFHELFAEDVVNLASENAEISFLMQSLYSMIGIVGRLNILDFVK